MGKRHRKGEEDEKHSVFDMDSYSGGNGKFRKNKRKVGRIYKRKSLFDI